MDGEATDWRKGDEMCVSLHVDSLLLEKDRHR
jgi:hypothetical protein